MWQLREVRSRDPAVAAAPQLGLLAGSKEAYARGDQLREHLTKFTQLQQAGIRVVRRIPLREHAEAYELLVVYL